MQIGLPRVCPRQLSRVAPLLDGEGLVSVAAVQLREAVHRHARRARRELQQARARLVVEGKDSLQPVKRYE